MPNMCDTNCTITGPDAEIERFKQKCLIATEHGVGIDFTRAEWGSDVGIFWSTYSFHDGQHWLWVRTAWSPPVKSLERISALFPELTFEVTTADEFYNFAYRGSIKAGVADLHEDEAAMRKYDEQMAAIGANNEPHAVPAVCNEKGDVDWQAWGSALAAAIRVAADIMILEAWLYQNEGALHEMEAVVPKMFARLQLVIAERCEKLTFHGTEEFNKPNDSIPINAIRALVAVARYVQDQQSARLDADPSWQQYDTDLLHEIVCVENWLRHEVGGDEQPQLVVDGDTPF